MYTKFIQRSGGKKMVRSVAQLNQQQQPTGTSALSACENSCENDVYMNEADAAAAVSFFASFVPFYAYFYAYQGARFYYYDVFQATKADRPPWKK